jgi:hypothetical protein
LFLFVLALPVAVTPALAATCVSGQVVGSDQAGAPAPGVNGITAILVRAADAAVVGATTTATAGPCGGGAAPGTYSFAITDQSGAFNVILLDERGCGAANSAIPPAGAPGCPASSSGSGVTGSGCAPLAICGYAPSAIPITLIGGAGTQNVGTTTLTVAMAPSPAEAALTDGNNDGAFGYVENLQGLGLGGLVVTATCGATTIPVATDVGTGRWRIAGLPSGTACSFTLSGPGVTAGANVGPSLTLGPWTTPGTVAAAGGGAWLNAGSFALSQAIEAPPSRGFVTGTVTDSTGQPLANVNVVLTDGAGRTYAVMTNGAGQFIFTGPNGEGVFTGRAKLVIGDNTNDYVGCPPGAACGYFPAFNQSVGVIAGQNVNAGTFALASKIAPSTSEAALPAGTVGAFGYAVNQNGLGIGGLTVTAYQIAGPGTPAGNAPGGAPLASLLNGSGAGAIPAAGVAAVQTDAQTGRFRMVGLTPGATYVFVVSGPGVTPAGTAGASCLVPQPGNPLAPGASAPSTCADIISFATAPAGTWADPAFTQPDAVPTE